MFRMLFPTYAQECRFVLWIFDQLSRLNDLHGGRGTAERYRPDVAPPDGRSPGSFYSVKVMPKNARRSLAKLQRLASKFSCRQKLRHRRRFS
jgi:hypothetical protein